MIYGLDDTNLEVLERELGDAALDVDEFAEGGLAEANVTITGFGYQEGGEEREGDDGKPYRTQDALVMHLHIDDWEELGLERDHTVQFLRLPRMRDNGSGRARPNKSSAFYLIVEAFTNLGVAKLAEQATVYQYGSWKDLIGLSYHRSIQEFQGFRKGQSFNVPIATEIHGIDNDVREQAGLRKAKLKS